MTERGHLTTPPGAAPFPNDLAQRIDSALTARTNGEPPRTRHRDGSTPHFTNRLIFETSPYLGQHAHNPVNWYPWGDEAFDEARHSGKPVFLSVGYSTCHWCHVMEEESFEDLDVARLLNERYVAIKVDREERPDVDTVYMSAVQVLTRQGGWPMSVWLDAERRPFYAGTYFPPHAFTAILNQLADLYRDDALRVAGAAESITGAVRAVMAGAAGDETLPGRDVLDAAARVVAQIYDEHYGGVRGAPKFPSSLPIRVLLREHRRTGNAAALAMAEHTLTMMAAGGMHDQLAGGFHRYSTDARWLVPHFEKMLYDNALLAVAYAEAWQVTGRRDFARIVRTTLDYILREMTSPDGAFYSATDADSEGHEGTFFLWDEREIRSILGPQADRFIAYYGVTPRGNFEDRNILFVPDPDEGEWEALADARETLRLAREQRQHPLRDDKVLTAWNALAISALAVGGRVLAEPRYVAAVARAADFALTELRRDGRVQRSWKDGRTSGPGFLEDNAFLTAALLDTYEATFDRRWLSEALALADGTEALFADAERGGWYRTASDHETLVAREKPNYDGAEPTGASVAVLNALRLHTITGDTRWRTIAQRALRFYTPTLTEHPTALHEMLLALDYFVDTPREVVLVWPPSEAPFMIGESSLTPLLEPLRRLFLPNRVLLGASEGAEIEALANLAPLASRKMVLTGLPTAYICEHGSCQLPTTDPATMTAQLTGY